ncbi:MAG: hypothetical protein ACK4SQ_14465 [Allorhizobium sp.]
MNHSTQTDLDTWLPVGELFAQIVAGLAPKVLDGVACRLREEEESRQAKSRAQRPQARDV